MQETDRGDVSHPVTIQEGTRLHSLFGDRIWTNSYHHQALKRVPGSLKVAAHSDDGVVEAVEVRDYPFGIGLQWHPEAMLASDDAMLPLFQAFIQAAETDRTPENNKYAKRKREDARPLFSVFSILFYVFLFCLLSNTSSEILLQKLCQAVIHGSIQALCRNGGCHGV